MQKEQRKRRRRKRRRRSFHARKNAVRSVPPGLRRRSRQPGQSLAAAAGGERRARCSLLSAASLPHAEPWTRATRRRVAYRPPP